MEGREGRWKPKYRKAWLGGTGSIGLDKGSERWEAGDRLPALSEAVPSLIWKISHLTIPRLISQCQSVHTQYLRVKSSGYTPIPRIFQSRSDIFLLTTGICLTCPACSFMGRSRFSHTDIRTRDPATTSMTSLPPRDCHIFGSKTELQKCSPHSPSLSLATTTKR